MTAARVRETTWEGIPAIVLENGLVSVTAVPSMGGHVASLVDVRAERELLWRNPRLTPRLAPYGAWFDDWWTGGWDEVFPGGDLSTLHDERLPYMGELWCLPWTASSRAAIDGTEASVTATALGNIAAARFTRTLELRAGEPVLWASYRIENLDVHPLPFTWGVHPAFAVTADHRIDLPANGGMEVGVASSPLMGVVGQRYAWPSLPISTAAARDGVHDMASALGREAGVFGGHWATDLADGWLALTDVAARRGVALVFDREVFPNAWLWQVFGGWRGHQLLAMEPWTSRPQDIDGAVAAGRARVLAPGERLDTRVAFALHEGLERVGGVDRRGDSVAVR
ncbi:MAG: aldose epimerase family protein [Candidatus Limnocylindrales bacterium]